MGNKRAIQCREPPYENCKILGPYTDSHGKNRQNVIITYPDGRTEKTQYARYLIEVHLGKRLDSDLAVDHKDNDCTNNSLDNLVVVTRAEHQSSHRTCKHIEQDFICPTCNVPFTLSGIKLHNAKNHRLRGSSGPFCSYSCASKGRFSVKYNPTKLEIKKTYPKREC